MEGTGAGLTRPEFHSLVRNTRSSEVDPAETGCEARDCDPFSAAQTSQDPFSASSTKKFRVVPEIMHGPTRSVHFEQMKT